MSNIVTLRQLMEEHPDWLDIPLAVYAPDGIYHYVGASGDVYLAEDDSEEDLEDKRVIVFSGN